jgi:hypothetical protein
LLLAAAAVYWFTRRRRRRAQAAQQMTEAACPLCLALNWAVERSLRTETVARVEQRVA